MTVGMMFIKPVFALYSTKNKCNHLTIHFYQANYEHIIGFQVFKMLERTPANSQILVYSPYQIVALGYPSKYLLCTDISKCDLKGKFIQTLRK